jgi:hypothetical protein
MGKYRSYKSKIKQMKKLLAKAFMKGEKTEEELAEEAAVK